MIKRYTLGRVSGRVTNKTLDEHRADFEAWVRESASEQDSEDILKRYYINNDLYHYTRTHRYWTIWFFVLRRVF